MIEIAEIRNWIILILAVIIGFITIKTFINNTKQRKIDNTYKTLDFLRRHIADKQIETFVELFHANNELTGVKFDEFKFADGRKDFVEFMFSEGGCGNGDIQNMIEIFNLISPTLKRLDKSIIWYEYGQIMNKLFMWTMRLEEIYGNRKDDFHYDFNRFMEKNWKKMLLKRTKHYTYAE